MSAADANVHVSGDDIDLIRQWFDAVEDLHQSYLAAADYNLADKLFAKKHKRPKWARVGGIAP